MIAATKKRVPQNGNRAKPKRKSLSDLDQLKRTANEKHAACGRGLRTTLNAAREAGEALAKIKKRVDHGNWADWIEKNFDATIQTARKYIKIYENWDEHKLGNKDITIEEACKVINNFSVKDDGPEAETELESKKQTADAKPKEKVKHVTVDFTNELYAKLQRLMKAMNLKDEKAVILALVKEAKA